MSLLNISVTVPFSTAAKAVILHSINTNAEGHQVELPTDDSVAIYNIPHTFIQNLSPRVPDPVTSTSIDTTTAYFPKSTSASATNLIMSTSTLIAMVPIATSTLSTLKDPSISVYGSSDRSAPISCVTPNTFGSATLSGDPNRANTPSKPVIDSTQSQPSNQPSKTAMAGAINTSPFSYTFTSVTTQPISAAVPGAACPVKTASIMESSVDTSSTMQPPIISSPKFSVSTTSNASTTEMVTPSTNNITISYAFTSTHLTTVDPSTDATTGIPAETATASSSSSMTTASPSSGVREVYRGLSVKAVALVAASVFNLGMAGLL